MSEPITWITKNGKHIPIYADKPTEDEQRKNKQIEQNENEANNKNGKSMSQQIEEKLIDKDSYLYSKEWKDVQDELEDARAYLQEWEDKEKALQKIVEEGTTADPEIVKSMGSRYAKLLGTKSPEAIKASKELSSEEFKEHVEIAKMGVENAEYKRDEFLRYVSTQQKKEFDKSEKTWNDYAPQKEYKYFHKDNTDWDSVDEKLKKGDAFLVEMSPKEYLQRCAYEIFRERYNRTPTYERQVQGAGIGDAKQIANLVNLMKNGTKMYTPYLDYKNDGQEGRHRAIAAMMLGVERMPVVIIPKDKYNIH